MKRAARPDKAAEEEIIKKNASMAKKPKTTINIEENAGVDEKNGKNNVECVVPLQDILGKWVVAHDVIVEKDGETMPPTIESQGLEIGCPIAFKQEDDGTGIGTATIDTATTANNSLEGTLQQHWNRALSETNEGYLDLPSGHRVMCYEWSPREGKEASKIGYSDVWDCVKNDDWGAVPVTVESCKQWENEFPLSKYLFETAKEAEAHRKRLPKNGFVLIVHWFGADTGPDAEFGAKQFLYLVRPESLDETQKIIAEAGSSCIVDFF